MLSKSPVTNSPVELLQLTDLHLPSLQEERLWGLNTVATFRATLAAALQQYPSAELIVLTGDFRLAEDLTQDVFLSAWHNWEQIDNPPGWVRTVVVNKARSSWRRRFASERAIEMMSVSTPMTAQLPEDTSGFWEQVRDLPMR